MPQIISVVGKSSSGKTTLLKGLIAELKRRGVKAAVIKHSVHDFKLDTPGKDTAVLAEAGAALVAFSSPKGVVFFRSVDTEASLAELSRLVGEDYDIVFTEGFGKEHNPKIEVHRQIQGHDLISPVEDLIAVASDEALDIGGIPRFALDDFRQLADLVERRIQAKKGEVPMAMYVDGKSIALGPFAREIVSRTLQGMVSALKGVSGDATSIDISIRQKGEREVPRG